MRRYYGISLRDLRTGRVSLVEVGALLGQLPMESAYKTALRDELTDEQIAVAARSDQPHGPWSRVEQLLAGVFDLLQQLIYVQVSRAGVDTQPPEPLPRPGVAGRKTQQNPDQIAYLARIREQHEIDRREG